MADNVLETIQRLIQDVIAPDVREIKVRLGSLEKTTDERFEGVNQRFEGVNQRFDSLETRMAERFDSMAKQSEAQFRALMSAIAESKAQSELTALRQVSDLRERVAVLESQRH